MANYRERRLPAGLGATVRVANKTRHVTITSVSETGCSMVGEGEWRTGDRVALNVRIPPVIGRIVRIDETGCGAKFDVRLSYGDVTRIHEGLRDHKVGQRYSELN